LLLKDLKLKNYFTYMLGFFFYKISINFKVKILTGGDENTLQRRNYPIWQCTVLCFYLNIDRNINTFSLCFVHNISPISLQRITMVCETNLLPKQLILYVGWEKACLHVTDDLRRHARWCDIGNQIRQFF
jgi:hypothetical protein